MQAREDEKGLGMSFFVMYILLHFIKFLFFNYYEAHEGPQQPTTANAGQRMPTATNEGQCRPTQNRYVFFVMLVHFIFYFLFLNYYEAHEGLQQPTTANAGQRRPTAPNEGQCRPTKTKKG